MVTREQYIGNLRKQHPHIYRSTMPDELVYHMGRQSDPYADVEDWKEMGYVGGKKIYKPQGDVSPSGWNELILKDINDDSWEWVKHAYANSLQGTLEAWKNGSLDYNIEKDYEELNIGEKILAGVGSFVMPLDLLTLRLVAPFTGSLMGAGIKALASKTGAKKLAESAAVKGLIGKANALGMKAGLSKGSLGVGVRKAIMSGNTIGLYESAKGGLAADIAGDNVFEGIAHGYMHGAMIGGVMGGVGGAMEANFLRYRMLKEARVAGDVATRGGFAKHYSIPELDKLMKYTGKHGQYAAEVASLQAFTLTDAIKNGELKGDKLIEQLIIDAGFVKVMNVKNRAISKAIPALKSYKSSLEKAHEDWKAKRDAAKDPSIETPFDPKDQVFSEKSEINKLIRENEGNTDPESQRIVEAAKQAKENLKNNLKPKDTDADILPELVEVTNLLEELKYHRRRKSEYMNLEQIGEQRELVKTLSTDFLKAQGKVEKAFEDGRLSEEIWRAKVDEGYLESASLEKDLFKMETDYDRSLIAKKTEAKKRHSELNVKDRYSKEDFDKILENEESLNNFLQGMRGVGDSDALRNISEQVKKAGDYTKFIKKQYKEDTDARTLADELSKDWTKIEKDKAGLKEGSEGLGKLEDSKKIVGYFAQNEMIRKGKTLSKGLLKAGPKRVREMYDFAKELAKKGKSFEDVVDADVENWLLNHPGHHTALNQLRAFLKDNHLSPKLFISASRITSLGEKTKAWGKEGFRTDHESWIIEKDKLLFRTPKVTEDVEKPISKDLSKSLIELSKVKLPVKEGHESFIFRLNTGEAMVNEDAMSLWNNLFGVKYTVPEKGKKKRDRAGARAMRKTLQQFAEFVAADRLKVQPDYAKKIIGHHLLQNKPDMKAVDKSYGPDKQIEIARNIVKEFIKEVNKKKPVKYKTEDWYYTPTEIKRGLEKFANRNEVFRMDGRQYSKEMLEPMIQYIIETAPRIDEIVPTAKVLNKQLKQVDKVEAPKKVKKYDEMSNIEQLEFSLANSKKKVTSLRADLKNAKNQGERMSAQGLLTEELSYQKGLALQLSEAKKKAPIEPKDMPPPPARDVDVAISYIKKSKIPHKDPSVFEKFKGATKKEQTKILADKDIIINALSGTPEAAGYKVAAKQTLNDFIERHMRWREYVKKNPNALKRNPNIGDVEHHTEWIKRYKNALKLLDKAPNKLSYGEFAGKNERNKLVGIAKKLQDKIGISEGEKQLGRQTYEKQLLEDTEGLFGKGVKSLGRDANPSLTTDNLYDYINFIGSKDYLTTNKRWRGRKNAVDQMARDRGITDAQIKEQLEAIEVKDGKWENVKSKKTVDYILGWLSGYEKLEVPNTLTDNLMEKLMGDTFGKFPSYKRLLITSPIQVFANEKLVGKNGWEVIAPLVDRPITVSRIRGIKDKYEKLVKKELPDIKDRNRAFMLRDTEIQKQWKKNNELTADDIKFIDNSLKEGTKEFKGRKIIEDYFDEMWGLWGKYGEEISKNPRIREELENALGKMYVQDYFIRRINPELLEALRSSNTLLEEGMGFEKFMVEETKKYIDSQIRKNVKKKEGEDPIEFRERQKEERARLQNDESTKNAVAEIIWNFTRMKPHELKNPAFMKRGVLFPRYFNIKDKKGNLKKVNSYLEKWDDTFDYYGNMQAQQLATWRHMPEFTSFGKKLKLGKYKANLHDFLTGRAKMDGFNVSSRWADYLGMLLEAELGMQGSYKERHNRKLYRYGGIAASTGAVLGLSMPVVPGIKNTGVGFANAMAVKPLQTTLQGWLKYFDLAERKKQSEKGFESYLNTVTKTQKNVAEEMGLVDRLPFGIGKIFNTDNIFKWNLMEKTEGVNRIADSIASGLYAQQLIDAVKGNKNVIHKFMTAKQLKKTFEFSGKNLFRWSTSELEFVKNTKYEDLYAENKTNPYTEGSNFNTMTWMMEKAEFYGQGATQGLTNPLMLPLWFSSPAIQPFTLFTRMATSVTAGMWTNVFRPIWEVGNPMPLVRYAAGSVFTGAGLYAFYKYILGQDQMHEMSDDKWKTVLQMAWRAEFLGMFSNALNPHVSPIYGSNNDTKFGTDPSFVTDFFEPYMIRSGRSIVEGISTVMTDPTNLKGWTDAVKHVTKTSVAIYGQGVRQWDRIFYPETQEWNKFRTAARSFKKEKGYDTPQFKLNTARQVYYRDLKNDFWRGDEKEFAKSYYAALAQIDTEMLRDGYVNQAYRRKQAVKNIETSLKSMNPVNFSAEIKGREMSKRGEFLNYLKDYDESVYNQALKSERTFQFKMRKLLASVNNPKYRLRYSPYYDR